MTRIWSARCGGFVRAAFSLTVSLSATTACSSSDDPAPGGASGSAGQQMSVAANGGAPVMQGSGGSGATTSGTAGTGGSTGARGGSGGSAAGVGGSASGSAGKPSTSGAGGGAGGTGGDDLVVPPKPGADGVSPYERECRGDTVMCEDVASLRCLGIRDGTTVFGYSCSNPCETDAECADAPSSAEAEPACVDFVTQKHCLLVCLNGGATKACPDGMSCYVYPQSPIGYCLWQ